MNSYLYKKIKETIFITDEEFDFAKSLFIPTTLERKGFILTQGEISQYSIFIEKGMLRTYMIDEKANEHTLQLGWEGWWAADLYSFLTNEPSNFWIEALEDCELFLISRYCWDQLMDKIPAFERYFRILIQNNLISTQRRLMNTLSQTAEEKYRDLITQNPAIFQRVPQIIIASYLGMTPETLSRVRGKLATEKR